LSVIGFIGGGAMAEAIIKGLLARGDESTNLVVSDKSQERLAYLKNNLGINIAQDNIETVIGSDVVILAVKPQNMTEAMASIASHITTKKTLISILAGVTIDTLENLLPAGSKVVRVMPNTPALVGAGSTVLAAGSEVTGLELKQASDIFQSVGSVTILPEKMLNAVTGLSGSGPAYIYLIIEALSDAGVLAGLPRDVSLKLASETVQGAAQMVSETKLHPGQLKDMVTSPGGTTIHGLLQMEKSGIRGTIMETVIAAVKRAEEL